jgi:lipid-binding SYLF domain-containing protein
MEIGSDAIKNARGLAFLTSYTVGFFGGGTFSHGILIAKKPGSDKWGLPVAISGGGATAMFGLGYREDITVSRGGRGTRETVQRGATARKRRVGGTLPS